VLGNARYLQQFHSSLDVNIRSTSQKVTKLIIILLPSTLLALPAIAIEPTSNIVPNSDPTVQESDINENLPSNNFFPSLKEVPSLLSPTPEPVISPQQVRLMTQELQGLIDRFEATLLTADAQNSNIEISTGKIIQQILNKQTITSKQIDKSSVKSTYNNAYQALQRAREGLKQFHYLINQQQYNQAEAEWSAAKQILWDNYPIDRPVADSEIRGMWLDRGTIVKAKSEEDLIQIFDRMATAGINTVFFETVNSGYLSFVRVGQNFNFSLAETTQIR
jgi:hypothetical protein